MAGHYLTITPESHPNHPVVGHFLKGHGKSLGHSEIYYCESLDPRKGYWLQSIDDPTNRRNVSPQAINTSFHLIIIDNTYKIRYCNWGYLTEQESNNIDEYEHMLMTANKAS